MSQAAKSMAAANGQWQMGIETLPFDRRALLI